MKYRYSVTIFRKIAIIDSKLRYTHIWKKVEKLFTTTKADALRFARYKCTTPYIKATLRKEGE